MEYNFTKDVHYNYLLLLTLQKTSMMAYFKYIEEYADSKAIIFLRAQDALLYWTEARTKYVYSWHKDGHYEIDIRCILII